MRILSPLRGGLFIIECARFSFLIGSMAILRHNAGTAFPWQLYAVPNALFLLMALFLWLDTSKYGVYSLLYISGKSLSLFSGIASGIAFSQNLGNLNFYERGLANPLLVLALVIIIDLISLVIALILSIKNKNHIPVLSNTDTAAGVQAADNETGKYGGA